jgi:hypothetical protein
MSVEIAEGEFIVKFAKNNNDIVDLDIADNAILVAPRKTSQIVLLCTLSEHLSRTTNTQCEATWNGSIDDVRNNYRWSPTTNIQRRSGKSAGGVAAADQRTALGWLEIGAARRQVD